MDDDKKMKVLFAPGALESLEDELSPEELQGLLDELKARIEDGTFLSESEPLDLDELRESDPDLYDLLMERLESLEDDSDEPTVH